MSPLEWRRDEEIAAEAKVLERIKDSGAKPKAPKKDSSSTTSITRRTRQQTSRQLSGYLKDYVVRFLLPKGKPTKSTVIGYIHMVSRCYCGCSEMLVFLAPTMQ